MEKLSSLSLHAALCNAYHLRELTFLEEKLSAGLGYPDEKAAFADETMVRSCPSYSHPQLRQELISRYEALI